MLSEGGRIDAPLLLLGLMYWEASCAMEIEPGESNVPVHLSQSCFGVKELNKIAVIYTPPPIPEILVRFQLDSRIPCGFQLDSSWIPVSFRNSMWILVGFWLDSGILGKFWVNSR